MGRRGIARASFRGLIIPAHSGRILVVDNDSTNRILLATHLKENGYQVEQAQDGWEALEILQSTPFDLVLLDLVMPKMDGFQMLERMKADDTLRHIPVEISSAFKAALSDGGYDVMLIPFDGGHVVRTDLTVQTITDVL